MTVPQAAATAAPAAASLPRYDRAKLACGIAHMSLGNFHRAHQANYLHEYLQTHPENWLIHSIGCLPADRPLVEAMQSQDNLYTLTERSGSEDKMKIIGSIKKTSWAPANPAEIIQLLASNDIKIISLTITEKGYFYNSNGDLDLTNPVILTDLAGEGSPQSALGYLFWAARQRMLTQAAPVTIMSCDNLPGNGHLTRRLLLEFAEAKEPAVGRWIRNNVAFPNSMVDRITPAVTPQTLDFVRDTFGIADRCPVASESYLQWVLEDNFANGRPQLEEVGVQLTGDVEPYEKLKVRLLNGSHLALAFPAYLMGFRLVDAAMNDPLIRQFLQRYMDEDITPTLPPVPGIDLPAYKQSLLRRFANPAISDQVPRLTLDGSPKIRNAIVPPLKHQLAGGGSIKWLAFTLAAWYRYLGGLDESGGAIEIVDPMSEVLQARAQSAPTDPAQLLAITEIFGKSLGQNNRLIGEVRASLEAIRSLGTRQALIQLLES
jgi:mannitol 2-dehydrogenase